MPPGSHCGGQLRTPALLAYTNVQVRMVFHVRHSMSMHGRHEHVAMFGPFGAWEPRLVSERSLIGQARA